MKTIQKTSGTRKQYKPGQLITICNNVFRIKRNKYKFNNKIINFEKYFCSIENYKHSYPFVHKDKVKHIIERYY